MSRLEKERSVSLLEPKNRGVFTVNFKHPLLVDSKSNVKSITKSLGADVGKDYHKAKEIVDEIKSIINNKECYGDFNGYLKCKTMYSKKAVDIIFDNTIFKNGLYDDFKGDILEKYIPLKSRGEDDKNLLLNKTSEYKEKKIQLIGRGNKSIKRILSQYIGSVKTNFLEVNRRINMEGSFEAHVCNKSNELEFVCTFLSKEALVYELKKNLYYSIEALLLSEKLNNKHGLYSNDETNEESKLSIFRNLTEGRHGENSFNLLFYDFKSGSDFAYIKEETHSLYSKITEKIKSLAKDSWIGFCNINKKANFIYGDNKDELIKEAYYKFLTKEDKEFSKRFNILIEDILKEVEHKRVNILKKFIEEAKNLGKGINWTLKILDRESGKEVNFSNKDRLCHKNELYDGAGLCDEDKLCDEDQLFDEDRSFNEHELSYVEKNNLSLNDLKNISSMASVYFSLSYRKDEKDLKGKLEKNLSDLELINKKPDKHLREKFFRILEGFSSEGENLREITLKPLINGIRIKGNFKPLWVNEEENFEDTILSYYEDGLNNEKSISNEVRKNMVNSHRILWVLEENENSIYNEEILKYLIINGYLNKSRLCFIEDESSKGYFENREYRKYREYIKCREDKEEKEDKKYSGYDFSNYYRVNAAIRKLDYLLNSLGKESGVGDSFVRGREELYKNKLINKVVLLNSLDKIILNREFAYKDEKRASEDKKNIEDLISLGAEREDSNLNSVFLSLKKSFEENKINVYETVRNLEELMREFEEEKEASIGCSSKFSCEFKCSKPSYKYEKLVYLGLYLNKTFREDFIKRINSSNWQELESFNSKIAYNYKGRSEGNLCPEYILECTIKEKLLSYLLNPELVKEKINNEEFEEAVMSIMESLSGKILEGVKRLIVDDNLEKWEKGVNSIEESFISRRKSIENIINENFYVDYEVLNEDKVLSFMKDILINNKIFREIKGEIKI
ncbi:hypothetical protein [Clostridium sp. LIBA-8841]|uniref:hypothetical protein n=1 Tax=Clostridium sp. LIBA-8841 TaxID=2987530 RepID=UPI002AC64EA8|nr:hypothetical protein [Clostridium sp. LIBA-8841]MDZ5254367.1 hypothetical protein [Clostridium sp. LIBA-8841]